MGQILKLFKNTIIIALFFTLISGCGIYKYSDAKKNPTNANERIKKNLEEGKGFRLGDLNKQRGGDFQFASANPLWRAGMEILSFAMALRYSLDLDKEALALEKAVQDVLNDGLRTKDILSDGMKEVSTAQMGDAIISKLQ